MALGTVATDRILRGRPSTIESPPDVETTERRRFSAGSDVELDGLLVITASRTANCSSLRGASMATWEVNPLCQQVNKHITKRVDLKIKLWLFQTK